MAAVKQHGMALKYASQALKADHDVVMAAVKQDGSALEYASEALKADHEVVMAAVKQEPGAIDHAPLNVRRNRSIQIAALNKRLKGVPDQLMTASRRSLGTALERFGEILDELEEYEETLNCDQKLYSRIDELPDQGPLKVLRSPRAVRDCGGEMGNCLTGCDDELRPWGSLFVKLEGGDGETLAVGQYEDGEWTSIDHNPKRRDGNRACGRGESSAMPSNSETMELFDKYLPVVNAFAGDN